MSTRETNRSIEDLSREADAFRVAYGRRGHASEDLEVEVSPADPAHLVLDHCSLGLSHVVSPARSPLFKPVIERAVRSMKIAMSRHGWLPATGQTASVAGIRITAVAVEDAPDHPFYSLARDC